MDYDIDLVNACPAAYVEKVKSTELSKYSSEFIINDLYKNENVDFETCYNATVAYLTPKINENVEFNNLRSWLWALYKYVGILPDFLKKDVRAALLRIPYTPNVSDAYFATLIRHKIDIREELSDKYKDWSFLSGSNNEEAWQSWDHMKYLAALETQGAYDSLEKKLAEMDDASDVADALESLSGLGTIEARRIVEKYVNDERMTYGSEEFTMPETGEVIRGMSLGKRAQILLQFW